MKRSDYTEANRLAWNETAELHGESQLPRLLESFRDPAFSTLDAIEEEVFEAIGLSGKRVAQLSCNNGRELLSVLRAGAASGVGFDISDVYIDQGRQLAAAAGLEARVTFVRSDVYHIPSDYDGGFDLVYVTVGAIGWLPDLNRYFGVVARLRQSHPERGVRDRGTENRYVRPIGRGQDAVRFGLCPESFAESVQKLPCRVRPRLESPGEPGNPDVVPDELILVDERVVHPVDVRFGQGPIVGTGRAEEVALAARLVQIVVEVRAGRYDAVHRTPTDQLGNDQAQAARTQRAGNSQEDQELVAEHPLPDAVCGGEIPSLERDPLHPTQHFLHRHTRLHPERFDRRLKKP